MDWLLNLLNPMRLGNELVGASQLNVAGEQVASVLPVTAPVVAPVTASVAAPAASTDSNATPVAAPDVNITVSQAAPSAGFIASHPVATAIVGGAVLAGGAAAIIMSRRPSPLNVEKEFAGAAYNIISLNKRAVDSLAKLNAKKDKEIIDMLKNDLFTAVAFADLKPAQYDKFDSKDTAGKKAYLDGFAAQFTPTFRTEGRVVLAMQEGKFKDMLMYLNPMRIANEMFGGEQPVTTPQVPAQEPAAAQTPAAAAQTPAAAQAPAAGPTRKLNAEVYEAINSLVDNRGHRTLAHKRATEIENDSWKVDAKVLAAFNANPEKAAQLFAQNEAVLRLFKPLAADKQIAKLNAPRQAEMIATEKKAGPRPK